jgi:hypothetical protein
MLILNLFTITCDMKLTQNKLLFQDGDIVRYLSYVSFEYLYDVFYNYGVKKNQINYQMI